MRVVFMSELPFKELGRKDVFLYKNALYMKIAPFRRYYADKNDKGIINALILSDGSDSGFTIHFDEDTMVIPLKSELHCWFEQEQTKNFSY